jgi:hypothetical protein
VPVAWSVQAANIAVGTHPTWHRFEQIYKVDKPTGAIVQGQEAYGGLNMMYLHAGTITPFKGYLNWGLYAEASGIDAAKAHELLALPAQQAVTVQDLGWAALPGVRTIGVSVGATQSFAQRTQWALAGQYLHDTYALNAGQDVGFASFGARSDEALTQAQYTAKYLPYDIGTAIAWDTTAGAAAACTTNIALPYAQQCNGLFPSSVETLRRSTLAAGKPLCPSVLWTSPLGTFVTTACIAPTGDIDQAETAAVSLTGMGLPTLDVIDALGSDQ